MKVLQCLKININQIKSLLWKDILIRKKQPWLTLLQFLWPCIIFSAIYIIRFRFDAVLVNECQYQTRQLPSQETVLPFFQSYMCTLDNTCMNTNNYEEITTFSNAPVTPVINIVQTFLNDEELFNTFLELPDRMHFVEAITTILTSKHFPYIQENINQVTKNHQLYNRKSENDENVNMTNLWSDDQTFSHYFYDLCGKKSVVTRNVRFVERTFYEKDYNGPDKNELDVMPTSYCKQLYLDITNSNDGKMTWNHVKPVIQGKILYGPATDEIKEIITLANGTFEGINRLKMFINSLDKTITRLRTDAQIKRRYGNLLNIATSPIISTIISSTLIDVEVIESILNSLMHSDTVATVFKTIGNILECFSVDRFVPVDTERELEILAFEMNKKKLFLGGIFFNVSANGSEIVRDYSYKIRMDIDNTPITIENRNRFWFPGPMSTFAMDMRYHRGFIQLQHSIDQAIVRVAKRKQFEATLEEIFDSEDSSRDKRSPQFGDFLDFFLGSSKSESKPEVKYNVDDFKYFTKEFPYPMYKKDTYKTGLYLYQAVQMAFFLALIIQVGSAVRSRIWLRESGNYTLMRIMGLRKSADFFSWFGTTLCELLLTFSLCTLILYGGGILETTGKFLFLCFLVLFSIGVIAFSFLISTLFTSASIGSVSAVIIFLITFTPYIIIVSLDTKLSFGLKFLPNLSFSTAFCYAVQIIMRYELQQKPLYVASVFKGSMHENELQFAIVMILFDTVIYFAMGGLAQWLYRTELSFHRVPTMKLHESIGATIDGVSVAYTIGASPALREVSLNFRRNCITCLLGRNGAGKSTIIRLLTGQVAPTSGTVYWSQDHKNPDKIGLCPQHSVVIPNLTAREHLELYASIKLTENPENEIEKMMDNLRLGKYENYRVENLSGGYKRLLNVAIAFLGAPNLVILDEPCSGIDIETRKIIWQLIEMLRKDRAVILATHYLDEAENVCDNIVIFRNGKIVSESSAKTLQKQFTKSFDLKIQLAKETECEATDEIKEILGAFRPNTINIRKHFIHANVSYLNRACMYENFQPLIESLEVMQLSKKIENFKICSKNLEEIFNDLNSRGDTELVNGNAGPPSSLTQNGDLRSHNGFTKCMAIRALFWKRFMHFRRNYKLMICILILPVLFEIAAMGLMTLRVPDEFDMDLKFSNDLYPNSATFYSTENSNGDFERSVFDNLQCETNCQNFNNSENAFRWILGTHDEHINRRFGGISSNESKLLIWYNNKGYHSMPVWLNQLSGALLKAELNDSTYNLTTINHPLKLGRKELSMSSILQQSGDAGISVILMIAFSYVIAGLSVYMVNERINGEMLQQKLCGISFSTYWGVSFVWDMMIYCTALLAAIAVIKIYDIPVYTAKENLYGIFCLLFMFGFVAIPMEHLFGKLYSDASQAAMNILCMNIVIGVTTILTTTLIDILGESDRSEIIRNILNRLFLIFPQHALADGLIVLCRNHITSEVMERFYINTYKSPIASDLLLPHYVAMFMLGSIFVLLNYIVETRMVQHWIAKVVCQTKSACIELQAVQINTNGTADKYRMYTPMHVLSVQNLSKTYSDGKQVLQNVSFHITKGECYGLLGTNGAGKSTIFSILSGDILQTSGSVEYHGANGISYCPQTNALDSLLTVTEVIRFYGTLRNVVDLKQLSIDTLRSYDLEKYANILVKNLSGGNRRKLNVAVTCFGKTDLVLMDEPTCDMDPVTRSLVYTTIRSLIRQQRSVMLTSHTITEIDRVCQRICVLRDGKIIAQGTPTVLQEMYGNRYLITIFCKKNQSKRIEIDLRHDISTLNHLIVHNHCLQFTVQIHGLDSNDLHLSELFQKLHDIVQKHDVKYTITECLLDQALEHIFSGQTQTNQSEVDYV